jgi:hypothetical protein
MAVLELQEEGIETWLAQVEADSRAWIARWHADNEAWLSGHVMGPTTPYVEDAVFAVEAELEKAHAEDDAWLAQMRTEDDAFVAQMRIEEMGDARLVQLPTEDDIRRDEADAIRDFDGAFRELRDYINECVTEALHAINNCDGRSPETSADRFPVPPWQDRTQEPDVKSYLNESALSVEAGLTAKFADIQEDIETRLAKLAEVKDQTVVRLILTLYLAVQRVSALPQWFPRSFLAIISPLTRRQRRTSKCQDVITLLHAPHAPPAVRTEPVRIFECPELVMA